MLTLSLIGLLGGLITAVSPCILPVLPVVFLAAAPGNAAAPAPVPATVPAGSGTAAPPGAAEGPPAPAARPSRRRNLRPYAVVAGLVLSFSFFTLLGVTLISALGLPDDILRYVGLTLLVLIGLGLVFPPLERLLEKPFARIPQRQVNKEGGAFVLGLGLGLLYVPCAGPVLAAITVAGARGEISADIVALTLSFAVGTAVPLLIFALAGRRVTERVTAFRTRARGLRIAAGTLMIALAFALALDLTTALQRALPDYTASAQRKIEDSDRARQQLSGLYDNSNKELSRCEDGADELKSCGRAPAIEEITRWLNTPGGRAVKLESLRGKVVLLDFWTYSCVNCQRSLPHVKAWDRAYRDAGLEVIGVHSPEFAFEKDAGNVADQAEKLGVTYPVALDNELTTWDNYRNRFWPAKYLIDARGTVRHFTFGEGRYRETEEHIRTLLTEAAPSAALPPRTGRSDADLTEGRTPETYLSHQRIRRYTGDPIAADRLKTYRMPGELRRDGVALGGTWTAGYEHFTAGADARLALHYRARNVNLVLAGKGPVEVLVNGRHRTTIQVTGAPTMYSLIDEPEAHDARLELRPAPGVQAFAFTFG
ncbi:cytochrome c biogenesis protein DipZ [Streptomyces sp. NPDC001985]|uniref:cytochrome c biogenesis protein DipZ n=1 Tax=Streptomyces sp. NPDC001985 TaxID=3154406 RepID=UPI0033195092